MTSLGTTAPEQWIVPSQPDPVPSRAVRVALVGIHGHGRTHLRRAAQLHREGICEFVAIADPVSPAPGEIDSAVAVFTDLEMLLATVQVDVVILCTPIHTHVDLAERAMRAGADVLLEKPPAPTLAEFRRLQTVCRETNRSCQVGFQSLASEAVAQLRTAVAAGALGTVTSIAAQGTWIRSVDYYRRSRWSGRRELDGIPVMDGAVTNPFAHAVATALRIDGSDRVDDVLSVEADLFHANDIESDDTSTVRIHTRRGTTLMVAVTLCASATSEPSVVIRGSRATATLFYTSDRIEISPALGHDDPPTGVSGDYDRDDLLVDLIRHRTDPSHPLRADLDSTGAFTAVLEALRTDAAAAEIPADRVQWTQDEYGTHAVVTDVEKWIALAVDREQTFTELGAPWTARSDAAGSLELKVGPAADSNPVTAEPLYDSNHEARNSLGSSNSEGTVVGSYDPGFGVAPTSSPRPFLHPLRTLGGVVVTDAHPADHDWHLGCGIAVPDVNGSNLWGGRTFSRDTGYQWRADHGRIDHIRWLDRRPDGFAQELNWIDKHGTPVLLERRVVRCRGVDPAAAGSISAWVLEVDFTLSVVGADPVELGSPGSNGRPLAGYGGFFWRLPRFAQVTVRTADAVGETDVHGSVSGWLSATLESEDETAATLLLVPTDAETARDRWFVRVAGYPAIGASLAWDEAVTVHPANPLHRGYRAVVADGDVAPETLALLAGAGPTTTAAPGAGPATTAAPGAGPTTTAAGTQDQK